MQTTIQPLTINYTQQSIARYWYSRHFVNFNYYPVGVVSQCRAPSFFNRSWKSKIIPEASASWRLKLSNLKKILKSVEEYYSDSLHLALNNFPRPDVQLIGINNYLNIN